MLPVIEQLLVLQDRDRKRLRLNAELANIPIQRRLLEEKALKAKAGFDSVKSKTLHAESERKKLELEVDTFRQRMAKLEGELNTTRSNDQYKAFQHQIDTIKGEIGRLEDRQLEFMEESEVLAREVQQASAVAAELKAETDKQLADLVARRSNLERELAGIEENRTRLAADVEPAVLARYERLLKSKGENSVVGVNRSTCGGCHMKLPMQCYVLAKGAQELVTCPNCSRILYHTPDMES